MIYLIYNISKFQLSSLKIDWDIAKKTWRVIGIQILHKFELKHWGKLTSNMDKKRDLLIK